MSGFSWSRVLELAQGASWLPGLALSRRWYSEAETRAFGNSLISDLSPEIDDEIPAAHAQAVADVVKQDRWPMRLPKRVLKTYYFRKLMGNKKKGALGKAWDILGTANQLVWGRLGLRSRPASLICLCGVDGSGKSTHAQSLMSVLDECEIRSRTVWLRGGYSTTVEGLKKIVRRGVPAVPGPSDQLGKQRLLHNPFTRVLWPWLVTLEQLVLAVVFVRVPLLRGVTLVAERYIYDTIVDMTERLGDPDYPRSVSARLLNWLAPRPDVMVLLDLPGEVAFARKSDDFDGEILETRRRIYRNVFSRDPRVSILDATGELDGLRQEIVSQALSRVLDRFDRENGLNRQPRDAWE
jgi:thymidylate kinase